MPAPGIPFGGALWGGRGSLCAAGAGLPRGILWGSAPGRAPHLMRGGGAGLVRGLAENPWLRIEKYASLGLVQTVLTSIGERMMTKASILFLFFIFFTLPSHAAELTVKECIGKGGHVADDLMGEGCPQGRSLGTIPEMDCPCVCCLGDQKRAPASHTSQVGNIYPVAPEKSCASDRDCSDPESANGAPGGLSYGCLPDVKLCGYLFPTQNGYR